MDLSVVVASHKNPMGLYLTAFAAIEQLSKTSLSWEVILACDEGAPEKWEKIPSVTCLRLKTGSPQGTRDAGIRAAQANTVLVIEDHVIVSDIAGLWSEHQKHCGAITVPMRIGESLEMFSSYGYTMDWDGSFWNLSTTYIPKTLEPHRILGFGHACFVVSRDWYIQSEGYFLEMRGWGGEEPDLNLLAYQTGREIWMIPSVTHAHFLTPGSHNEVSLSENYKRNFCIAAYEHGGKEYLHKAEKHYGYKLQRNANIEARRRVICGLKYNGDLNALREYLKNEGIA